MPARPAIVSTVRDSEAVLDSFIRYHLSIGFERIYLFFDDPKDPCIELMAGDPRVVAVPHDAALRARWRGLKCWPVMREHIDTEVMSRQILNCELAISMAADAGCDWILHIDSDEALFCLRGDAAALMSQLDGDGVDQVTFMNFEALPERRELEDFFREVTLFKVNPYLRGKPRFNASQVKLIREAHFAGPDLMNFNLYSNGKCAAKIDADLVPLDVHAFTRRDPTGQIRSNPVIYGDDAIILHYPNCGIRNFEKKYETLGKFDDRWFGTTDILPFHRKARDVCATGDPDEIRRFYERRVMLHPDEDLDRLLANGILARIPQPARLLQRLTAGGG